MYCYKCGTRLTGNEKFCFHCGTEVKTNININSNVKETNGKKIASIVLGVISLVGVAIVIFSPISLILSLIGLIIGIIASKDVSNVPGIVINAIGLFISLIFTIIIAFIIMIIVNVSNNVDIEDIPWDDITNKVHIDSF